MAFQPRQRPDGTLCCHETLADGRRRLGDHPCPTCRDHHDRRAASLRTAVPRAASKYEPPDPWAAGIAQLQQADAQAAAAKTHQPVPRSTEIHLDEHGVPDPYAAALEQMRKERR
jgi:hypothetical protein